MDTIKKFLETEISYQDMYNEVISFILSPHIRNGELEGNEYIVKKMDHTNFIIYLEYELQDGSREIHFATAIYRRQLIEAIESYAKEKGISTEHLR